MQRIAATTLLQDVDDKYFAAPRFFRHADAPRANAYPVGNACSHRGHTGANVFAMPGGVRYSTPAVARRREVRIMNEPADDDRLSQLFHEAFTLPKGPARLAVLEEAIRLADSLLDEENGYEARQLLIETATFVGRPDLTLVAFSWCLAVCDRSPEKYDLHRLLWEYKWVVGTLTGFPAISRVRIDEIIADMEARYRRAGSGLHATLKLRCRLALEMGDTAEAVRYRRAWEKAPRDGLSDCPACELDDEIGFLIGTGDDAHAVERSSPILKGRLKCAEVPHLTLAQLVLPMFRLGRFEQAMECHLRGYRMILDNPDFLTALGSHLTFAVLTDNRDHAVRIFERHLPLVAPMPNQLKVFEFLLAGLTLLTRLEATGPAELPIRLPKDHPLFRADGPVPTADLRAWAAGELGRLADVFDARHGNTHFRGRLAAVPAVLATVRPMPLPVTEGRPKAEAAPRPKGPKNDKW